MKIPKKGEIWQVSLQRGVVLVLIEKDLSLLYREQIHCIYIDENNYELVLGGKFIREDK